MKYFFRNKLNDFIKTKNKIIAPSSSEWLERKAPFSRKFGLDRGDAIDRVFIHNFINKYKSNIKGSVLEFGDDRYTLQVGSNVLNSLVFAGKGSGVNSISIDADLTDPNSYVDIGKFDCIICTNVLNFIYDFKSAVKGLADLTSSDGGVCLCTVSGISQISKYDYERWEDYWRFNDLSMRRVFFEYFEHVEIEFHGNAPLAAAQLMGLCYQEVPKNLFEHNDNEYQMIITIKASSPKN